MALAPTQVRIVPWSRRFRRYADHVHKHLTRAGLRSEVERREESVKFKTREAFASGACYAAIVGPDEERAERVSLLSREAPERPQPLPLVTAKQRLVDEASRLL